MSAWYVVCTYDKCSLVGIFVLVRKIGDSACSGYLLEL